MVLMGVAGSGKSAVGAVLAARLSAIYLDGDDLHPPENIAKMSRGEPLTDDDAPVIFVHLAGRQELIAARMGARAGHFMPMSLIDSQFAALEPPEADENAITVDIDNTIEAVVAAIAARLEDLSS
ncbi:gluconokinase [Rhizobium sp. R693]|nr:gluconokinase [Rhizobium sp. R693]